ncbi:hypothetical protein PINS_up004441 [Pythium insidiosum]|nr:hypothetical protein PINS_up004441 [Pythium insidiosum]
MIKVSLLTLLASALVPSAVNGHGFLISPEPAWVVNPFDNKNAPASFYDVPESERNRNPLDVFPNLRFIIDRDRPNVDIAPIAANANKKCGMTNPGGPTRTLPNGNIRFGNYGGGPPVPHIVRLTT